MTDDLIGRAEAQTAIQFAARRYTVAHEAHGEGQVVWSDNLINVTDAMNVLRDLPSTQPEPEAISKWKKEFREYVDSLDIARDDWKGIIEYIDELPSIQPERKDAIEKAVAVEAICDELMSRFDVSATYAYEIAEKAMNRIEAMAKELERGEQE